MNKKHFDMGYLTKKLVFAEFCGFFVGDGTSDNRRVILYAQPHECNYVRGMYESLFLGQYQELRQAKFVNVPLTQFCVCSQELASWFRVNCYLGGIKTCPEFIFSGVCRGRKFLRGLFEADGTVGFYGHSNYISLSNTSSLVIEGAKRLLSLNGIYSREHWSKTGYKDICRLYIAAHSHQVFMKFINFATQEKRKRFVVR